MSGKYRFECSGYRRGECECKRPCSLELKVDARDVDDAALVNELLEAFADDELEFDLVEADVEGEAA